MLGSEDNLCKPRVEASSFAPTFMSPRSPRDVVILPQHSSVTTAL
jgi:hypothetical protein